jgi:hypothetical protein
MSNLSFFPKPNLMIYKEEFSNFKSARQSIKVEKEGDRRTNKSHIIDELFLNHRRRMSRDVAVFALERTCLVVAEEKHKPAIVNISISPFTLAIRDSYRGYFSESSRPTSIELKFHQEQLKIQ